MESKKKMVMVKGIKSEVLEKDMERKRKSVSVEPVGDDENTQRIETHGK